MAETITTETTTTEAPPLRMPLPSLRRRLNPSKRGWQIACLLLVGLYTCALDQRADVALELAVAERDIAQLRSELSDSRWLAQRAATLQELEGRR